MRRAVACLALMPSIAFASCHFTTPYAIACLASGAGVGVVNAARFFQRYGIHTHKVDERFFAQYLSPYGCVSTSELMSAPVYSHNQVGKIATSDGYVQLQLIVADKLRDLYAVPPSAISGTCDAPPIE